MSWIRIDDQMVDHPKIAPLSDAAFRSFHRALSYANRFLTDGLLSPNFLSTIASEITQELIAAGVWERRRGDGVWIHDFLDFQPSKREIKRQRKDARQRKIVSRAAAKCHAVTPASQGRVTDAFVTRRKHAVVTAPQPNPTQPIKRSPQPPFDKGGSKVRREHRDQARAILRAHLGYCQHDPQCPNQVVCLDLIAHEQAEKAAS